MGEVGVCEGAVDAEGVDDEDVFGCVECAGGYAEEVFGEIHGCERVGG